MKSNLEPQLIALKKAGLKITPSRKKILEVLASEHGPFSAEDLFETLQGSMDMATIYRNLLSLTEIKLAQRCEFRDGIARYELAQDQDHHHHHLVCEKCKKVEVLDLCKLEPAFNKIAKDKGYTKLSHSLELFGLCPECAQ